MSMWSTAGGDYGMTSMEADGPATGNGFTIGCLLQIVRDVDEWLDAAVSQDYKDQPLAQDWARVCKESEERGESIAELILATGQNPRKGTDPEAAGRLLMELADRVVTPFFAIQHFTKDERRTWAIVAAAFTKAAQRAAAAGYGSA
jgi:hypothetical protein